ncbi:hypothetical protein QR680_013088 [Steinernema hermaphroditum]|uniref:Syndetin C-terminal domain-containing protein n=1 Tax=Steinernema hermaphroditum TaxID=289476 RepID=A0AA39M1W8_9BILA|nr:hypothetical protein QR680_013088 [Steinernema hermaphroditum]
MELIKKSISNTLQTLQSETRSVFFHGDSSAEQSASTHPTASTSSTTEYSANSVAFQQQKPSRAPRGAPPVGDETVLRSIPEDYFRGEGFDAVAFELQKMLHDEFSIEYVERERLRLKRQLQVVSKKVSALIVANAPSYSAQMERISQMRSEVGAVVEIVSAIREDLHGVKMQCNNGLEILANDRKKCLLQRLRRTLLAVKTLYETEYRLKELIQNGEFPAAIHLCIEAKNAARAYSHFSCISELSEKLTKIMKGIEGDLDDALASMATVFDADRYALICGGYRSLDKELEMALKLVEFFRATMESSARSVLLERVRSKPLISPPETLSYEQLCENVPVDVMLETVRELGFVVCKVLCGFHAVLRHHVDEDERIACGSLSEEDFQGVVQRTLSGNLYSVSKTASAKFNTLLCCHDLSLLKFDQFLDIVEMANGFKKFGREHFGNACGEVSISLEKQTVLYFGRYHRERMEELRMFLENEAFALCPVPMQFTLFDLQEFFFLKEASAGFDAVDGAQNLDDLGEQLDFVLLAADAPNPFVEAAKTRLNGVRKQTSSDDSVDDDSPLQTEVLSPTSDVDDPKMAHVMPNLCNTALNLLKFFGRYIRMTSVFHSVADEATVGITQLFSYFFYSVFVFFGSDSALRAFDIQECPGKLRGVVEEIRATLIDDGQASPTVLPLGVRLPRCQLSPVVDLSSAEDCFALSERVVAVESVVFVAKQLDLIRPVVESLLASDRKSALLERFYNDIVPSAVYLRDCVYGAVASRALRFHDFVHLVATTHWDVNELQSQHSAYVDFLLEDMRSFALRFERAAVLVHVSRPVRTVLWENVIQCAFKALVQGYVEAGRKCSNEGRALMQLDLQQLVMKMETMVDLRPIPYRAYVENYIKAYYLPESSLEQWIAQHKEYTGSQMIALLNVATHVSKKARTRIISALDD